MKTKKVSKWMATLIEKHGEEKARALVHEWTSNAGKTKGKPKGFATNRKLASEAGRKGAAKAIKNRKKKSKLTPK